MQTSVATLIAWLYSFGYMLPIGYRRAIGKTVRFIGNACFYLVGLLGFVGSLAIVLSVAGFWGLVFGFTLAPLTFMAAPWYALVAWGNPTMLVFNYGGIIFSFFLQWLGEKIIPQRVPTQQDWDKLNEMAKRMTED
jgi:hypothetical protein